MVGVAESDIHIIFAGYAILPYNCKLVTTCTCLYTGGSRHPHEQHFLKKEVPSILVVKLQQRAVHCTRRKASSSSSSVLASSGNRVSCNLKISKIW